MVHLDGFFHIPPLPDAEVEFYRAKWAKWNRELETPPVTGPLDRSKWRARRGSRAFYRFGVIYTAAVFLATGLYLGFERVLATDPEPDQCDDSGSMSTSERRFQINIRVREDMSFAQAKGTDLGWDIAVGHGGRVLHGWVFYHLSCKTVTWMLEQFALQYSVLLDLMFRSDSWWSLWSLTVTMTKRQPLQMMVTTTLLAYALIHVLSFGTIWSAATGYQSNSVAAYAMWDQTLATRSSEHLRLCWSMPPQDLLRTGVQEPVVVGPTLGEMTKSFEDVSKGLIQWSGDWAKDKAISEEFLNLHAYARFRTTMQWFLPAKFNVSDAGEPKYPTHFWDESRKYYFGPNEPATIRHYGDQIVQNASWLIKGWQFPGVGQEARADAQQLVQLVSAGDSNVTVVRSWFQRNDSIPYSRESLPYNSTLWYKNVSIALEAPLLRLGYGCSSWYNMSSMGVCLCYKKKILTQDFLADDHRICTGGGRYIWGFSSFITAVGLILESIWCAVCWYLWTCARFSSQLVKAGRTATGPVRNLLDVAEAINDELGDTTCLHTDKELSKRLAQSHPVGYTIQDRKGGTKHIGLVPVPAQGMMTRRLVIDTEASYG